MHLMGIRMVGAAVAVLLAAGVSGCAAATPAAAPSAVSPTATALATATDSATDSEAPADVCARAAELTADDPEAAVALIDDYRAPALARLEAGVEQPGDDILASDCEEERVAALVASPTPKPSTPPVAAVAAWKATLENWLTPLGTMLVAALAVAAALIVLARLLVFLVPWPSLPPRWRRSEPFTRRAPWWPLPVVVGGALITVAAWGLATEPFLRWTLTALGALLALGGTWRAVHWFGARPRIQIAVTGSNDAASSVRAAHVAALTLALGAAGPRAIDVPGASDINQITAATGKVTGNALITFVTTVVEFVAGVSPWRVTIIETSEDASIVEVRWNGHLVGSTRIRAEALGLGAPGVPSDAVPRMQAAFVASTLAANYVDMRGLYGATDWRSVGLTFVATLPCPASAQRELLRTAVGLDPRNALARRRLANLNHEDPSDIASTDAALDSLEREANALAPLSGDPGPFPHAAGWMPAPRPADDGAWYPAPRALLARVLLLWVTLLCNRIALATAAGVAYPGRHGLEADVRAIEALHRTVEGLPSPGSGVEHTDFIEALQGRTAIAIRRLNDAAPYAGNLDAVCARTQQWLRAAVESGDPGMSYRLACRAAMLGLPADDLLTVAFTAKQYIAWAPKDPELFRIRDSKWALLHPDVPPSVLHVAPLAAHREKLDALGVRSARELVRSGNAVRTSLSLDRASFAHLQRVARLAAVLSARTPERWQGRVPLIFASLTGAGIDTLGRLRRAPEELLNDTLRDAVRGIPRRGPTPARPYVRPERAVELLREAWLG